MKTHRFAAQILIDYGKVCRRRGYLPFGEFVALWHASDALMQTATDAGFEPNEVLDVLITDVDRASADDDSSETVH